MIDSILTKLGDVSSRYEEIETLLSQPDITSNQEEYIKLSKEYSDLSPLVTAFNSFKSCLLYTSPSPRDATLSRMPSSA